MQNKIESKISNQEYEKLITKTINTKNIKEKSIVTGKVISVEKDIIFKSLSHVQSIVEKKNTIPVLSNILMEAKDNTLVLSATDMDILTDGTDKFVGGVYLGKSDAAGKTFLSSSSNDVITMNGSTKGGIVGTTVTCYAAASAKYVVTGIALASGTVVTPSADA